MSGYALIIEGSALSATIVGGGSVATRKARTLAASGARVRVVAPSIAAELRGLAAERESVTLVEEAYDGRHLEGARLVIAATDDPELNARIAAEARARGALVNVVDAPELGDCVTPAVHASGDLLLAVTTGGVPGAAARIRDEIAARLDGRYADALRALVALRRRLLDGGDRERWRAASRELVDARFCARVEDGTLAEAVRRWA